MSEDYLKDEDLLSILEGSVEEDKSKIDDTKDETSEVEKAMSDTNPVDTVDTAVSVNDIKDIADKFSVVNSNPGTGDTDADLANWFDGTDSLPSEGLNNAVANASIKLDYGLTHSTLTSFRLMSKLRKFIEEDAFDLMFSENAILGLDSEDILDRVKTAFTMYKELGMFTQRTVQSMRDYRLKAGNEGTEVDRLSMLLSSIPSDKLHKVLEEISYGNKVDKQ